MVSRVPDTDLLTVGHERKEFGGRHSLTDPLAIMYASVIIVL